MSEKKRVRPSDIPPLANAFSGAVGGAVANFAVYPMNLIVTRLQLQHKKKQRGEKAVEGAVEYDGILDAFKKIYQQGGIKEFYHGAGEDTIAIMTAAFFYFFAYEAIRSRRMNFIAKRRGGRAPATLGVAEELAIGTVAGMFCKFLTSPLNNVVTRKQALKGDHTTKEVARSIWNEKGLTGFWTGYKTNIILSINPSLTYYFFQYLKAVLLPRHRRDNPTSAQLFWLSACAKTIATLLTYPWMLSKTRLQAKSKSEPVDPTQAKKNMFFNVITDVTDEYQRDGFAAIYQGCKGQVIRSFFTQGITMMTKDQIARIIIYWYFAVFKKIF